MIDKIFKTLTPSFQAASEISRIAGADQSIVVGLDKAHVWTSTTRDAMAFWNIFNGVIGGLVEQTVILGGLIRASFMQQAAPLKVNAKAYQYPDQVIDAKERALLAEISVNHNGNATPVYGRYNQFAVNGAERAAALVSTFFAWLGSLSFIGAFGVCRPIQNVDKHILTPIGVQNDPVAQEVGGYFHDVMFGNHGAGFIHHNAEMAYQTLAYNREANAGRANEEKYSEYRARMCENTVGVLEKGLESLKGIVRYTGGHSSKWFDLSTGILIGLLAITKEYLKPE